MSQYPPGPPMSPPMPPSMGPPGSPYGYPAAQYGPSRTSGTAIASFICGLLGCFLITPILALLLGIFGIIATKNPRITGRGFAIAGIILAILWLAGFGMFGGLGYTFYVKSRPVAAIAQQFMADEVNGNIPSAMTHCDPSSITADELQTLADTIKTWGTFQDLSLPGRNVVDINGNTTWMLVGPAKFNGMMKMFTFTLRKQPDGSFKIVKYQYQ